MQELYKLIISKAALIYYVFILLVELLTKYGIIEKRTKDKALILLIADTLGVISVVYLVFICITKVWWAFIPLLLIYIVIFKVLKSILTVSLIVVRRFFLNGAYLSFLQK